MTTLKALIISLCSINCSFCSLLNPVLVVMQHCQVLVSGLCVIAALAVQGTEGTLATPAPAKAGSQWRLVVAVALSQSRAQHRASRGEDIEDFEDRNCQTVIYMYCICDKKYLTLHEQSSSFKWLCFQIKFIILVNPPVTKLAQNVGHCQSPDPKV